MKVKVFNLKAINVAKKILRGFKNLHFNNIMFKKHSTLSMI